MASLRCEARGGFLSTQFLWSRLEYISGDIT